MSKILYIHPTLETGGAEEIRFLTLKYATRDKQNIKVLCIQKKGAVAEKIENLGYEVICLDKSSKPYDLLATFKLFMYLIKNKFDIVQTSLFEANFHGRIAAKLAGVPVIISEEHSEHYQYNSFKFKAHIYLDKFLSMFTDKIICCSEKMMYSISKKENISMNKLIPIVNAIDFKKFENVKNRTFVRKSINLDNSNILIGNIASLSPRKGQDCLIRAFSKIHRIFPSSKLVIVGREHIKTKDKLCDIVCELRLADDVIFLGERQDIPDLLNAMDIFVLSSVHEGLPLSIVEAMYMGVPVISTDTGGVSEIISNGVNGILVSPGDPDSLSDAIADLLNNSEKSRLLAKSAKDIVSSKFDPNIYINKLNSLYEEILKKKRGKLCAA